jgi:hypothetical protein
MRRPRSSRPVPPAFLALAVVTLSACADRFVLPDPAGAPQLVGEISAATARPGYDCMPMRAELAILDEPAVTDPRGLRRIVGRAHPGAPLQPWWLEGELYENGVAAVTLFQSTINPSGPVDSPGAKPMSVFRGTLVGTRLDLAEQGPSCARRLVAEAPGS